MASNTEDLALVRTLLAYDRTLMAWIRTSVSLISFGFTVYKFFQYLIETEKIQAPYSVYGPRRFGLTLIAIGVLTLAVSAIDYRHAMRVLAREHGTTYRSMTGIVAALMCIMGLSLLVIVFLRL